MIVMSGGPVSEEGLDPVSANRAALWGFHLCLIGTTSLSSTFYTEVLDNIALEQRVS